MKIYSIYVKDANIKEDEDLVALDTEQNKWIFFWGPLFYFGYRRMYLEALLTLAGMGLLFLIFSGTTLFLLLYVYNFAWSILYSDLEEFLLVRRGYVLSNVIAEKTEDEALVRYLKGVKY